MAYRIMNGVTWFTLGAQKGLDQPPYAVRWRGRWYRTLPLHASGVFDPTATSMSDPMRAWIEDQPRLDFGLRRVLDYLIRTGKRFSDLPLMKIPLTLTPIRRPPTRAPRQSQG